VINRGDIEFFQMNTNEGASFCPYWSCDVSYCGTRFCRKVLNRFPLSPFSPQAKTEQVKKRPIEQLNGAAPDEVAPHGLSTMLTCGHLLHCSPLKTRAIRHPSRHRPAAVQISFSCPGLTTERLEKILGAIPT
jgi:hypothetical protein